MGIERQENNDRRWLYFFPLSFRNFVKHPVTATLFLCLIAISYMYVDARNSMKDENRAQKRRIVILENRDSIKNEALRKCDSALSAANMRFSVLEQLGKIKTMKK